MATVRTVGELAKAIQGLDPDMPLWISASCYEHDGRVFTQVRPSRWKLMETAKNPDGSETDTIRTPAVQVAVEPVEHRTIRRKGGHNKYEYRDCLVIANNDTDDMELDED